jgi:hypothetical protein
LRVESQELLQDRLGLRADGDDSLVPVVLCMPIRKCSAVPTRKCSARVQVNTRWEEPTMASSLYLFSASSITSLLPLFGIFNYFSSRPSPFSDP